MYFYIFSIGLLQLIHLNICKTTDNIVINNDTSRINNVSINIFQFLLNHGNQTMNETIEDHNSHIVLYEMANSVYQNYLLDNNKAKLLLEILGLAMEFHISDKKFNEVFENSDITTEKRWLWFYYLLFHDQEYVERFINWFKYLKNYKEKIKQDIKLLDTEISDNQTINEGLEMLLDKIEKTYASRLRFFLKNESWEDFFFAHLQNIKILLEEKNEKISKLLLRNLVRSTFEELELNKEKNVFENIQEKEGIKKIVKLSDTLYYKNMERLNKYYSSEKYKEVSDDPDINNAVEKMDHKEFEFTMIINLIALENYEKIDKFDENIKFDTIDLNNYKYLYEYMKQLIENTGLPVYGPDGYNIAKMAVVIIVIILLFLLICQIVIRMIKNYSKSSNDQSSNIDI